jgi:hypothetical protein
VKKTICILALLIFSAPAYSLDQAIVNSLNRQGLDVIMGELTGAGSKVSMQRLAGFVMNDGILLKENCQSIVVNNAAMPDVTNIVRVVFDSKNIEAGEFIGIIVKK